MSGYLGLPAFGAQSAMRADQVRKDYEVSTAKLAPEDSAARSALKAAARIRTPAIPRTIIEAVRPGLGPKSGSLAGAARTNVNVNEIARGLGRGGRVMGVLAALGDAVELAEAEDKARALTAVAGANGGGVAGGIGGAEAGAALGVLGGPFAEVTVPLGAIVGGALGSMGGGFYGHQAGEALYDRIRPVRSKEGENGR